MSIVAEERKLSQQDRHIELSHKDVKVDVRDFSFYYDTTQALKGINLRVRSNSVVGIIGPSGCGKSTFLRCFNRMNDTINGIRYEGSIEIEGHDIFDPDLDVVDLRRNVGMVFQKSNPFPKSIFENVAYGLRIHGERRRSVIEERVEKSMRSVLLFDSLKDRLSQNALELSLEAQQRLCIARLLSVTPDVLLMDEPCSALDPMSTMRIEELMAELKKDYTIIIVTHNMQQAARVSDECGFMLLGELVEFSATKNIFTAPKDKRTDDYITGRFG